MGLELKWMHLAPMIRPDHIKLKRAYEPPAPDDGTRNIDGPIMAAADRIERDSLYESHSDGFGLSKNHL